LVSRCSLGGQEVLSLVHWTICGWIVWWDARKNQWETPI